VAGCTDAGLWITKGLLTLDRVIWLGRVAGLARIEAGPDAVSIGAAATHAQAFAALGSLDPDVAELMRRFGSAQVRASGTVGGNIANGSPIGDLAPALIALGATLELRRGTRPGRWRSRTTSSPTDGRTAAPASSCAGSSRRAWAPTSTSAASRCRSASTRTSPR
jgi:xanthine dehydrogenase iron-sulfur cluster and FAD-binding subunit A